jgi:microcystin-dependent protein
LYKRRSLGTTNTANVTRYFDFNSDVPITVKRHFTESVDIGIMTKRHHTLSSDIPVNAKRAFNYTAINEVDETPTGIVYQWAGAIANIPSGYLLCDGSSLLRSSYPGLFTAIGTIYGSADGSHFNLPDLRDKFVIGARQDNSGIPSTNVTGALTANGGAIDYAHSGCSVAPHSAGNTGYAPTGISIAAHSTASNKQGSSSGTVVTTATHSVTEPNSGQGHQHTTPSLSHTVTQASDHNPVLPPYLTMAFIIKT